MSRRQLARESGLSEPYLRDRLNDVYPLSLNDVASVCKAFQMDPAVFLGAIEASLPIASVTPIRPVINDGPSVHDVPTEEEALELGAVAKTDVREVDEFDGGEEGD